MPASAEVHLMVSLPRLVVVLARVGHASCDAEALTEGASGYVDVVLTLKDKQCEASTTIHESFISVQLVAKKMPMKMSTRKSIADNIASSTLLLLRRHKKKKNFNKNRNKRDSLEYIALTGVGWPSKMESTFLRVRRCSSERRPASHQAA